VCVAMAEGAGVRMLVGGSGHQPLGRASADAAGCTKAWEMEAGEGPQQRRTLEVEGEGRPQPHLVPGGRVLALARRRACMRRCLILRACRDQKPSGWCPTSAASSQCPDRFC
jgi:hypothetical protein